MIMAEETSLATLKKVIEGDQVIIGTQRTIKALKKGEVKQVYISANTPKEVKDDIKHYADIHGAEIIELSQPNDELGSLLKKPFSISVIGVNVKS